MTGILQALLMGRVAAGGTFTVVQTFTGTGTWTAPTGVTSVDYLVVGGGGGGVAAWGSRAAQTGGSGGSGGTGGAATPVTQNCVPVTPGSPYPITVASPGGQVVISWNPQ